MDYKVSIFFTNDKDMVIILAAEEFELFLQNMSKKRPHWNKDKNNGFGIPLYNIMYYSFVEYTEVMKKTDQDAIKKANEPVEKKEEVKPKA